MEDFSEERANLHQRIGELEIRVQKMTIRLTEDGLDMLSLRAAEIIEDQFAQHHVGGRTQRLAKVQMIVREALREIATGERAWDAWRPAPNYKTPEGA